MKKVTAKKIRRIGYALFLIYLALLIYFVLFAEGYGRTIAGREYRYNLVPLKEISRFIKYRYQLGPVAVALNLIGNIIAFVPFGMILPIIDKSSRKFYLVALLSFQLSLVIELAQLVLKVGSCDVDDIILNTLGGCLGYLMFYILNKIRRKICG